MSHRFKKKKIYDGPTTFLSQHVEKDGSLYSVFFVNNCHVFIKSKDLRSLLFSVMYNPDVTIYDVDIGDEYF